MDLNGEPCAFENTSLKKKRNILLSDGSNKVTKLHAMHETVKVKKIT